MWKRFASLILHYRIVILLIIAIITSYTVYRAQEIKLDYNYAALLPKSDPYYIEFQKFKKIFGEDANISIIGIQDENFFQLNKFYDWKNLQDSIKKVHGVKEVLSVVNAIDIVKNSDTKKFQAQNIFKEVIVDQKELDSLAIGTEPLGLPASFQIILQ